MNLVKIRELYKSYGDKVLFNHISLNINEGDKIGLLGVNGTGKSTLLRIIVGQDNFETGEINVLSHIRMEYLSQNPYFDNDSTVLDQIFKSDTREIKILKEYEKALKEMDKGGKSYLDRLTRLQNEMDLYNLWSFESEIKSILTKLKITDFDEKIGNLSGGQKKRVALAAALVTECDLLVLDEPTNHMDSEMTDWLEEYLNERKGSLVMVTHDRYFLDRVTNQIVELDNGNIYQYDGNYTYFVEKKLERQNIESSTKIKNEKLYKKELDWIRKGAKARTTKQKARIDRFEDLKSNINQDTVENFEISAASSRLGKSVIELKKISKSYDNRLLIDNFSYIVKKQDKIGVVGPNGSGKSTLLKIIMHQIQPDDGEVKIGQTVKIAYFSQENETLDEGMRVIDYIRESGEFLLSANGERLSAAKMLEKFLFSGETQHNYIGRLSGGEKRRLYLLKSLMEAPNVILLDEPTNDLDITTLSILEDYLDDFNGSIIVISHDRYFLDRVCNTIISFEENGSLAVHTGNYSTYLENREFSEPILEKEGVQKSIEYKMSKPKKIKLSYNEQAEFDKIDGEIEKVEKLIREIAEKMESHSDDYVLLQELMIEKEKLDMDLLTKYKRWEYLNELVEKIEQQ
ncbi:MAG: ABC-F family ATP-binding cassette domain-containing protein [Dethiosulfatibacter sp.]|nr:ABC-F family ATP-binding cassette domain-containing protein [Dethiosulfatibacter sp.]